MFQTQYPLLKNTSVNSSFLTHTTDLQKQGKLSKNDQNYLHLSIFFAVFSVSMALVSHGDAISYRWRRCSIIWLENPAPWACMDDQDQAGSWATTTRILSLWSSLTNVSDLRWLIHYHNQLQSDKLDQTTLQHQTQMCCWPEISSQHPTSWNQLRLAYKPISSIGPGPSNPR